VYWQGNIDHNLLGVSHPDLSTSKDLEHLSDTSELNLAYLIGRFGGWGCPRVCIHVIVTWQVCDEWFALGDFVFILPNQRFKHSTDRFPDMA